MKSALVVTRSIASRTSSAMPACWAFRSTSGMCFSATPLTRAPHVRSLVEALEADELVHALDAYRWAAGDDRTRFDILGHDAARTDERAGPDAQPRQDGRVGADADVILDRRAEHALQVARADRVRIVGEHHVGREKDSVAQRRVL